MTFLYAYIIIAFIVFMMANNVNSRRIDFIIHRRDYNYSAAMSGMLWPATIVVVFHEYWRGL